MLSLIFIAQIVFSVFLIIAILLQQRGGGLSPVLGGEGGIYHTRRGMEKWLHWFTVIVAVLFLATALFNIVIR